MVNPTLSRKNQTEQKATLSNDAKRLFQVIYTEQNKGESTQEVAKIKVSSFLSKMAFYYEKIRNSIDYKEEHLLRKTAIERILKREIIIQGSIKKIDSLKISKNLLTELIRAAYLPNNSIPESKIKEIGIVINKYIKTRSIFEKTPNTDFKQKNKITNWLIGISACEIEERLRNDSITDIEIEQIYKLLTDKVNLPENSIYTNDKEIQIYISIYRKLLKFDDFMIGYIAFKYYVPNWIDADEVLINKVSNNLDKLINKINEQVNHPLKNQLNRVTSRYAVFFNTLTEVISSDPNGEYKKAKTNYVDFSFDVKKICEKKYAYTRARLWRAALRSIIYIFITKSVFVFLLEIPIIKWFGEEVNPIALAINIGFPAMLLFVIVLFTQVPDKENTTKIISGIEEILFDEKKNQSSITLKPPVKRGAFMNSMFGIIYTVTFFSSFGFIIWGLRQINFNWVSITIFLFFLAFVSFFSIRIRKSISELRVLEPKENIFSFLMDFFYMPIIATGKFLSEKFSRVNVFVFIMDFIMEAPFKAFVEIAEEWAKYVKERRDEIV